MDKVDELMADIKAATKARPTSANGYGLRLWKEIETKLRAALAQHAEATLTITAPNGDTIECRGSKLDMATLERIVQAKAQQSATSALIGAAEAVVDAWKAKYRKPSTDGFRRDAPLAEEVANLNAALRRPT